MERSRESAVDRDWKPDTPNSEGVAGEAFALIRNALLNGEPVYADFEGFENVRIWDLQHKAGDWMRIGFETPEQNRYLKWSHFDTLRRFVIGNRHYRVVIPRAYITLTEVY